MPFETALIATVVALCGTIVFLFHFFMRRSDRANTATTELYRKQADIDRRAFEARMAGSEQKWADAIARIRVLEDARLMDERQHGHELKALASEVLREASANRETHRQIAEDNRRILRELITAIERWRETGEPPEPEDLPHVATEAISRKPTP